MANYANLKATINANIKANGAEEITGPILNNVLNAAVNALGAGWQYMGVATPATSPGTPDANVFYIASMAGTYTNFGGLAVAEGEVAILKYNGSWTKEVTGAATAAQVTQLGQEVTDLDGEINGFPEVTFQKSDYSLQPGIITGGVFRSNSVYGTNNSYVLIPMAGKAGRTIRFATVSGHYLSEFAFLASNALVSGETPPYCVGASLKNTSGDYVIPNDCAYLYVYAERQGSDSFPSVKMLNAPRTVCSSVRADAIEQSVADFKDGVLDIIGAYNPLTGGTTESGYYYDATTGTKTQNSNWSTFSFVPQDGETYFAIGSVRPSNTALALYFDTNNSLLGIEEQGTGTDHIFENYQLTIPSGTAVVRITGAGPVGGIGETPSCNLHEFYDGNIPDDMEAIGAEFNTINNALKDRVQVPGTFEIGCYYNSSNGARIENTDWNTFSFVPQSGTQYYANGFVRPSPTALALYYANNTLIGIEEQGTGTEQTFTNFALTIPNNCTLVRITGNNFAGVTASANYLGISQNNIPEQIEQLNERIDNIEVETGHWNDKTIWWCGTSIPAGVDSTIPGAEETIAGNYPTEVGNDLNATVINKSVGASMCRANVRTGDYVGANFSNITSCLSMTKEEIENFIANYSTIKNVLTGNVPETLDATYIARLRSASFEDRLIPYLDGTYDMPDLFVIDHGHNDFKYTLSGGGSDIGLEPTVANIGGELAEDTFMTANNNAKLESFLGSFANIPSARKAEFIASLNRNCYIGAVNFIVTLILHYNPHARIIFISNYEYENGATPFYAPLIPAQESIAKSWAFPLCEVYKYLGYSNHIIPGSMAWFNTTYPAQTPATTDITVYKAYLPDGVHPHTDITGDANNIYAGVISEFIKKIY